MDMTVVVMQHKYDERERERGQERERKKERERSAREGGREGGRGREGEDLFHNRQVTEGRKYNEKRSIVTPSNVKASKV